MMKFAAMLITLAFAQAALAMPNMCRPNPEHPEYQDAIATVAAHTKYSVDQLCNLERLADIFVAERMFYNEKLEPIPHTWVTLHYWEYSCQYFVRKADLVITKSNCYSTF